MKIKYLSSLIMSLGIIFSAILIGTAMAQSNSNNVSAASVANIQYPIAELGNCPSESACRVYCDKAENMDACLNFAEKKNLMNRDEINVAKKFKAAGNVGPGGCKSKDSCETYCNDISHIDECVSFGERSGMLNPKDLEDAKKVLNAIKKGVKPPCGNKEQCDTYCSEPDHMETCITFAQAAGFMSNQELQDSQKVLSAIKQGIKPPLCRGKEQCDVYCSNPDNMESCMKFAQAAGLMNDQEIKDSQKVLSAIKQGIKPPLCRGKEQCDNYCSQEGHFEECMKFAEAAGFMTAEEAMMARKTGGKGPGGCNSKDSCEAFCNIPDNQQICLDFGKEHGLIKQEDLQRMDEGKKKFQEMLDKAPSAVIECLNSSVGSDVMEKYKSGTAMPPQSIGEKIGQCFQKVMSGGMQGGQPNQPGQGQVIPNGFPSDNFQGGPGECKSPEECKKYCEEHSDECKNFSGSSIPKTVNPANIMPGAGAGMQGLPPQAVECLKSQYGSDFTEKISKGEISASDVSEKVRECLTKTMPRTPMQQIQQNIPAQQNAIPGEGIPDNLPSPQMLQQLQQRGVIPTQEQIQQYQQMAPQQQQIPGNMMPPGIPSGMGL